MRSFDLCRRAHLSVRIEKGNGLTKDLDHTRPADILIAGWDRGKPAVLDITITSPLCPAILGESCHQAVQQSLQQRPVSYTLMVLHYGNWGKEAQDTVSTLVFHLAIH
eukprot:Em0003g519a